MTVKKYHNLKIITGGDFTEPNDDFTKTDYLVSDYPHWGFTRTFLDDFELKGVKRIVIDSEKQGDVGEVLVNLTLIVSLGDEAE